MYDKEAKMMEDKINNQMKLLEKQLNKLNNINYQNHTVTVKELNAYKQSLLRDITASQDVILLRFRQKIKIL